MKRKLDSRTVLTNSVVRRLRHAMVRCLDEYDRRHEHSEAGEIFKTDMKNMLNDMMRCTHTEMQDYEVHFRPVKLRGDNSLFVTKAFIEGLEVIDFTDTPSVRFYAHQQHQNCIHSLRAELGAGVTYMEGDKWVLEVVGERSCVDDVLPFLDRFRMQRQVRENYVAWRKKLVERYTRRQA